MVERFIAPVLKTEILPREQFRLPRKTATRAARKRKPANEKLATDWQQIRARGLLPDNWQQLVFGQAVVARLQAYLKGRQRFRLTMWLPEQRTQRLEFPLFRCNPQQRFPPSSMLPKVLLDPT